MTLKEIVCQEFLTSDLRNYSLYQLNYEKLGIMYDKMVEVVKNGESFQRFLNFEGATTSEGKIRFDLETTYFDRESKKDVRTKVIFKYPVYKFLYERYNRALSEIKEKENQIPLPPETY